jgi:Zn-dependent protease with chaperone function
LNVANAFAFPGGTIVVSDSVVQLTAQARNGDDMLAAIFAHELAHVERRHGLQMLLHGSAALVAVATLTGDLSSLTAMAATLPFLLIQRGYSRDFEREADTDAVAWLRAVRIQPAALADALQLLEQQRPKSGPDFTYLSTHPSTSDRVKTLRDAGDPRKKS